MYRITLFHRIVAVVILAATLQGCSAYSFKAVYKHNQIETMEIRSPYDYFYILHVGGEAWQLKNVDIQDTVITAETTAMDGLVERYMYHAYGNEKPIRSTRRNQARYFRQVHIHVSEFTREGDSVSINPNHIDEMYVMKYRPSSKPGNKTAIILGSVVGGVGGFLLIACNCPHTYVYNGTQYYYSNTLFTGATSVNLERNDYKIMPDYEPESSQYNIYIKSEDKEVQYINLLELLVIEHDIDTKVAMDQDGNVHAIENVVEPEIVKTSSGDDLNSILAYEDEAAYSFDGTSDDNYNYVYASFDVPNNNSNAKIILSAKNNSWSGFVYNEFSQKFGKYYDNWVKRNEKKSKEEVYAALKKVGVPLVVSVKKNGEWVDIEEVELIGDVSYNSLAIPVASDLISGEKIEIRLRSGFMFWDLDYLSMDFTPPTHLNVQRLSPSAVSGSTTTDGLQALSNDDHQYVEHLAIGDSTSISFTGINVDADKERTIYLRSKGYYLPQKEFEGKFLRKELQAINVDGGLSILSRRLYEELFQNVSFNKK
jgi:hypothetical protein